jgi:hypothetical protein
MGVQRNVVRSASCEERGPNPLDYCHLADFEPGLDLNLPYRSLGRFVPREGTFSRDTKLG